MTVASLVRLAAVAVVVVALWQYRGPVRADVAAAPATGTNAHRTRHLNPDGSPRFTNRLAKERSPYLRQHAHNPVDWYPWGHEALQKARTEKKPILLSIGYSTCHWCHVMERESFEDEEIAAYVNEHFVPIKVDREERPDLDAVYMAALHAMGQSGGWPLTMFLTPDGRPFYGGTYFPPRTVNRRIGFTELLQRLRGAWALQNEEATAAAADLTQRVVDGMAAPAATALPTPMALRQAQVFLQSDFDEEHGGFGDAPKFPRTPMIEVLLRSHRRSGDPQSLAMAERTLDAMAAGGIHDQLGGGFHRYTTDDAWRVPHFEKMLPDQALLAVAYLEGYQATGRADLGAVARRTLDYVVRELADQNGGFHAAVDADSDGGEGRFYTWTPDELAAVLDEPTAKLAAAYFAVTPDGNLQGRSILATPEPLAVVAERLGVDPAQAATRIDEARTKLYGARAKRTPPHVDTKVVTSWNGLTISALARGAQALREPRYAAAAGRAADALLAARTPDGRLVRSTTDGVASGPAFLEDYAFLIAGLLDLYEATGDPRRLEQALALQTTLDEHFWDEDAAGYFRTADDAETLLVREKPDYDGAEPSGNSVAVQNLLRLWELTTEDRWRERAELVLQAFGARVSGNPQGMLRMISALDFLLDRPKEIVIVTTPTDDGKALLDRLHATFVPNRVLIIVPEGDAQAALAKTVPLVAEKTARDGKATAYVCEQRVCQLPTSDPAELATQLARTTPMS